MARQRLGQHFLADARWREQIARAIGASAHSTIRKQATPHQAYSWREIGAGQGEMMAHVAAAGDTVYAMELDLPLAARLDKLAKEFQNLSVVHADVLKTGLAALASERRIRV